VPVQGGYVIIHPNFPGKQKKVLSLMGIGCPSTLGALGQCSSVANIAPLIQQILPMAAVNAPQAIFDEEDAECLLTNYPEIFSGYAPFTILDTSGYASNITNDDELNSQLQTNNYFTASGGNYTVGDYTFTASSDINDIIGYIMVLQPGVTQVVPLVFYQNAGTVINAAKQVQGIWNAYELSPQDQVINASELIGLPGYGYITPSNNIGTAAATAAATQTAQQSQINLISEYTDNLLNIQANNPGFFGSFEGFALIAGAIVGLGALASAAGVGSGLAVDADVSAAQSAAEAGAAAVNVNSGVVAFGNGVIYNPTLGANGAFYLPSNGAWTDAVTGQAITDASSFPGAASLASTGDALSTGDAQIVNGQLLASNTSGTSLLPTETDVVPQEAVDTTADTDVVSSTTDATGITTTSYVNGDVATADAAGNATYTTASGASSAITSDGAVSAVADNGDALAVTTDGTQISVDSSTGLESYVYTDGSTYTIDTTTGASTYVAPDGSVTTIDDSGNVIQVDAEGNPITGTNAAQEIAQNLPKSPPTTSGSTPPTTQSLLQDAKAAASVVSAATSFLKAAGITSQTQPLTPLQAAALRAQLQNAQLAASSPISSTTLLIGAAAIGAILLTSKK
jgi:hypothetical protein